ncbi:MAG: thioredoxin family protein [Gammaproteobacteria bacterium]|nr:thioredoxin family protein [Gammaproteobacteria bacterium]
MGVKVEVFSSPGCGKCGQAKHVLRKVVEEFDPGSIDWREVNVLAELDYAVQLGVLTTPAIAINGELCYTGLPSAKQLRQRIQTKLEEIK